MQRTIQDKDLSETIICKLEDSALEVARILRDTRARHLIVLNGDEQPQGIISVVDVVNRIVAEEKDPKTLTAADFMTKKILSITPDTVIDDAVQRMSENNISSLPVVDKEGKLLGVLEFTVAMRAIADHQKAICEGGKK